MTPGLHHLVLALAADWWRRQWHNVAIAAVLLVSLAALLALYLSLPFGGGLS